MSSLVDIWTAEFERLREKARSIPAGEPKQRGEPKKTTQGQKEGLFLFLGTSLPTFQLSDATVSLLVDCFAP
ncbi:hypothetical protein H6P81_020968 [Aristolochia fimbriata]|uniref:Uncharacterized protein n=1 Tax=Aristolochia fimbriata TaxID=158543 RepID=A0AAV7DWV2_ARIFI|nr:hypothetical protein H6P81_020968 [Aristolochia fimbriata]